MMRRLVSWSDQVLTWFEDWTLFLAVAVGLVSLFCNVILRYFFNAGLPWSEELIREIIIYTTLIGCSAALKRGTMISIDALAHLVPRLRKPLEWAGHLSVLIYAWLMIHLGWQITMLQANTGQKTVIMQIPLWIVYLIVPLMGVLMGLRALQAIYYRLAGAQPAGGR